MRTGRVDDLRNASPKEVRALLSPSACSARVGIFLETCPEYGLDGGKREKPTDLHLFRFEFRTLALQIMDDTLMDAHCLGGVLLDQGGQGSSALGVFNSDYQVLDAIAVDLESLRVYGGSMKRSFLRTSLISLPNQANCVSASCVGFQLPSTDLVPLRFTQSEQSHLLESHAFSIVSIERRPHSSRVDLQISSRGTPLILSVTRSQDSSAS
jgi:hypothetical protein